MAITTSNDQIIIQVVESSAATIPGEDELTRILKNQTARMLEKCFDERRRDALESATQAFTESVTHLHKLLCLQEGVHESQWIDEPPTDEELEEFDEKREQINHTVEQYIERQVRRYISFVR